MPKRKRKLNEWLETEKRLPAHRCTSCEEPWRSTIHEVLAEMASGRVGRNVTFAGLHRFLVSEENFDPPYPLGIEALRTHIRGHETKLYTEWVTRGR
tara:strand:- start:4 stop:294 length:291 start_codon:yes stop_codon:yes gene_type:complete